MKKLYSSFYLIVLFFFTQAKAEVKYGGYIDNYYAYDFNAPSNHEREFTTQPVRSNEFNVNLAYAEAIIQKEKTRGRLALQFGQSVIKNTIYEPTRGQTSGPQDAKIFQEAYIGKKLGEKTWIDMGIFLGNIGAESWISKDNWTYSRALNLDYVPYYSSGVRIDHSLSKDKSIQLQILNGWQNMSENNKSKAIGMQYKQEVSEKITFTYNNFFGDERIVSNKDRYRGYHNFILKYLYSEKWQFLGAFDFGHQAQQQNNGVNGWMATTLTLRRVLNADQAIAMRSEYYNDPHQSNVLTGTKNGFEVIGQSVNFDQKLDESTLWRTELRGFYSKDKIYPTGPHYKNRLDGFIATSLSMWF
ncbi:MAG: outer membrane beta-barrel protein [Bacteriovoracaceae bacterium]